MFGFFRREPSANEQSDSALLQRFVSQQDQAAFAALVQRYSGLVMRVCLQVLRNTHDAQDAFQAAFIALARKAYTIREGAALAGWLHQVAYHCAVQARSQGMKRQVHEKQVAAMRKEETAEVKDLQDIWPILHEEVDRLPAKLRTPVVLCYLDGKTNEEAASQLNWPVGTVKTRLAQGRELLKERLQRRGVVLPIGLLGAALASKVQAEAAVSTALIEATVRAATQLSAGKAPAAVGLSPQVNILADSALRMLFVAKLKAVAATVVFALGLTTALGGLWWYHIQAPEGLSVVSYFFGPRQPDANSDDFGPLPAQRSNANPEGGYTWTPSTYRTTTTPYPPADPVPKGAEGTTSSRQPTGPDAPGPRSREEHLQQLQRQQKLQKAPAEAPSSSPPPADGQPPEALPVPPQPLPPDPDLRPTARWWELIWTPW